MREIKFRARILTTNEWVTGFYFYDHIHDRHFILTISMMGVPRENQIDVETLGQYTGLNDKNGVEIYEHDLVLHGNHLCEVLWIQSMSCYKLRNRDKSITVSDDWLSKSYTLEVIGNIHENPELLTTPRQE